VGGGWTPSPITPLYWSRPRPIYVYITIVNSISSYRCLRRKYKYILWFWKCAYNVHRTRVPYSAVKTKYITRTPLHVTDGTAASTRNCHDYDIADTDTGHMANATGICVATSTYPVRPAHAVQNRDEFCHWIRNGDTIRYVRRRGRDDVNGPQHSYLYMYNI